jgi:hypothetical protein
MKGKRKMKRLRIISVALLMAFATLLFSGCLAKVPVPEKEEGRFDFSITYETNGSIKTYYGTYVCKFDGTHTSCLGSGRDWSGYIEGAGDVDIPIQNNNDGIVYINLGFFPEYFMSDPDYAHSLPPEPNLYIAYHSVDPNSAVYDGGLDFMAVYGIRIISYDYPEPIENTFNNKLSCSRFELSIN